MRRCDYITSHSGNIKIHPLKHIDEVLLCQHCEFTTVYSDNLEVNSLKHNGILTRKLLGWCKLFYKDQCHAQVYQLRVKSGMGLIEIDATYKVTIISLAQYIVCADGLIQQSSKNITHFLNRSANKWIGSHSVDLVMALKLFSRQINWKVFTYLGDLVTTFEGFLLDFFMLQHSSTEFYIRTSTFFFTTFCW